MSDPVILGGIISLSVTIVLVYAIHKDSKCAKTIANRSIWIFPLLVAILLNNGGGLFEWLIELIKDFFL